MCGTGPTTATTLSNGSEDEALSVRCTLNNGSEDEALSVRCTQLKSIHHQIQSSKCLSDSSSLDLTEKMQEAFDTKLISIS